MLKYLLKSLLPFICCVAAAQTPRINFTAPKLYPEGTAWYSTDSVFFVSSVTTGAIVKVHPNNTYSVFYADASLKSSYGMKVDMPRHKLWVCTGDANYSIYSTPATYKKMIRLIGLDLTSGLKIDDIDLSNLVPGQHFANDLTLDANGNIYITDSYSPAIYKVDTRMKASVFSQNPLYKSIDIGLNGIVWHPNGYLIVAHSTNGALYKVSLKNPDVAEKIDAGTFFPGADGLLFDGMGNLAVVQNKGTNKVFQLRSADNWSTAQVTGSTILLDRLDNPTTLTKKNQQLFVLNAKINELSDPTRPPSSKFSLQLVRFVPL